MPLGFKLKQYRNHAFVETGTYHGHGVWRALKAGFKKIYSIEISSAYFELAKKRFPTEISEGRVELLLGDSSRRLEEVIKKEHRTMTFWLDAHSMPSNLEAQAKGTENGVNCPLYEEIAVIGKHPLKTHTIMIDDVRLLDSENAWGGHNVTLKGIKAKIRDINSNYQIVYENGYQKDDVLIAFVRRSLFLKYLELLEEQLRKIYRRICS